MIGMMLPSAAPMILIYVKVGRQSAEQGRPLASAAWFAAGYLADVVRLRARRDDRPMGARPARCCCRR